jgi:hypothetical protein
MQTSDSLIEFGLYAVGFLALMRVSFHLRAGASIPAGFYAVSAWLALTAKGIFYGPPRALEAHLGFAAAYAATLILVIGVFLHLHQRRMRRVQGE